MASVQLCDSSAPPPPPPVEQDKASSVGRIQVQALLGHAPLTHKGCDCGLRSYLTEIGCLDGPSKIPTPPAQALPQPQAEHGTPADQPPAWSTVVKMIAFQLQAISQNYLDRAQFKPSLLVDRYLADGHQHGGQVHPAQLAWDVQRINSNLDHLVDLVAQFTDGGPFTIQRLIELVLVDSTTDPEHHPQPLHPHYSSLPKYLRAIHKVLSVSSSWEAYRNPLAQHSLGAHPTPRNGVQHTHDQSSTTSSSVTSSCTTPLLSPIPWLTSHERLLSPELADQSHPARRHSSPLLDRALTPPLTAAHHETPSNPHPPQAQQPRLFSPPGRVDELDLGVDHLIDHPIPINSNTTIIKTCSETADAAVGAHLPSLQNQEEGHEPDPQDLSLDS